MISLMIYIRGYGPNTSSTWLLDPAISYIKTLFELRHFSGMSELMLRQSTSVSVFCGL